MAEAGRAPRGRGRGDGSGERDERGLMTLEWLLIVAAVAGLAAVAVYVVQRVVEDEVVVIDDPTVLVLDAEIAAAFVVEDAYEAALREAAGNPGFDPKDDAFVARFEARCEELEADDRFGAVVVDASFNPDGVAGNPYRCELVFRNLAEP